MNYIIDGTQLTAIADAIRAKTGKGDTITVDEMPDEISGISGSSMPMGGVTLVFYDGSTFGDAGPTTIIEEGSV